jgi:pSer/pThr/pTyr-binding forkhead associated (FHA) protein
MGLILRCTGGPAAGRELEVERELLLGRDEPEPGRLRGDPQLSRRHARIYIDDQGRPVVEDLGSTNGTWVNDSRLRDSQVLRTGDRLRAGKSTFQVKVSDERPETPTEDVGRTASAAAATSAGGPALTVLAGPAKGQEIPLDSELLIGRSFGEPGALGGDRQLSRRHARVARGPEGVFFLEDTGSTNGTELNHVRLRRAPRALRDGDEIELGSCKLRAHGLPRARHLADEETAAPLADSPTLHGRAGARAGAVATPPGAPPAGAPPDGGGVAVPAPGSPEGGFPAFDPSQGLFHPQGAAGTRLKSHHAVGAFAAVFALAVAAAIAVVVLVAPLGTRPCPDGFVCPKPLRGQPLRDMTTYHGPLGWRVEYDSQLAKPINHANGGNQLVLGETPTEDRDFGLPGTGLIAVLVRAYPSTTSAQSAVQNVAGHAASTLIGATTAPSSDQLFGVPVLGFHPGTGLVVEGAQRTPQGPGSVMRVAVIAATSGKVTMAFAEEYPILHNNNPQNDPDTPLDNWGDQILETVRFPSDGDL